MGKTASPWESSKENEVKEDDEIPADATNYKDSADDDDEERDNESRDKSKRKSKNTKSFSKEEGKDSNDNDQDNNQHNKPNEMVSGYFVPLKVEILYI